MHDVVAAVRGGVVAAHPGESVTAHPGEKRLRFIFA